ncbi:MAG: TlpA disulfide reductase family protein [bacterium]
MEKEKKSSRIDMLLTIAVIAVVVFLLGHNLIKFYGMDFFTKGSEITEIPGYDPRSGTVFSISIPKDKTVVINFWATWCAACLKEIEEFKKLHTEIPVFGVMKEPVNKKTLISLDIPYKIIVADDSFFNSLMISSLPTTFIIKNNVVTEIYRGKLTASEVISEISK